MCIGLKLSSFARWRGSQSSAVRFEGGLLVFVLSKRNMSKAKRRSNANLAAVLRNETAEAFS